MRQRRLPTRSPPAPGIAQRRQVNALARSVAAVGGGDGGAKVGSQGAVAGARQVVGPDTAGATLLQVPQRSHARPCHKVQGCQRTARISSVQRR